MRCTASGCRSRRCAFGEHASRPACRSRLAGRPVRRPTFSTRIYAQLQTRSSRQPAGNRAAMASPSWPHRPGRSRLNVCMRSAVRSVDEMAVLVDPACRRPGSGFVKRLDQAGPDSGDTGCGAAPETAQTGTNPPPPSPSRRAGEGPEEPRVVIDKCVHQTASLCQIFREPRIRSTHRRHPVRRVSITICLELVAVSSN